jgi:hypothetical protein
VRLVLDTNTALSGGMTAKCGPVPKLMQHMVRISQLSMTKQRFVMEVIESVLVKASR